MKAYNEKQLTKFDKLLVGTHHENEKKLKELIPFAKILKDKSIYLEMLSRLALFQSIQRKFKLAHQTLNKAEKALPPKLIHIQIKLMIERGRLYHLSNNNKAAIPILKKAYNLSKKYHYEDLMIDALHFMPSIVKNISQKIKWNLMTIDVAKRSRDKKMANDWLAILYQSIGLNYIDAQEYQKALKSFKKAKKLAIKFSPKIVVLGAEIGIAKSLRLLNYTDKAFNMLIKLLKIWSKISKEASCNIFHGWICEELAEIYLAKAQAFSVLSYKDLSQDEWHKKFALKRLHKLKSLSNFK